MALDSTKVKDTQFYSGWNIERIQKRVERDVAVGTGWGVLESTPSVNNPPLKFYAMYKDGAVWKMSGSYGVTNTRVRSKSTQLEIIRPNGAATVRVRYYIMYNKLDATQ